MDCESDNLESRRMTNRRSFLKFLAGAVGSIPLCGGALAVAWDLLDPGVLVIDGDTVIPRGHYRKVVIKSGFVRLADGCLIDTLVFKGGVLDLPASDIWMSPNGTIRFEGEGTLDATRRGGPTITGVPV
jgi:hypothetical protein